MKKPMVYEVRRGREPFEVCFLLASCTIGAVLMLSDIRPQSIQASMPALVRIGWEIGLIVAGLLGLAGIFWPGRFSTALGIELGGLVLLGTVMSMFGLAIIAYSASSGLPAGVLVSAIAGAAWTRSGQVVRAIRSLERAVAVGSVSAMSLIVERRES